MNPSKFDTVIKNRANQRVTEKINRFREEIATALRNLHGSLAPRYYHGFSPGDTVPAAVEVVLKNVYDGMYFKRQEQPASHENPLKPCAWPSVLWRTEEQQVEKELLATMDEMQKALCAPEPSEDINAPISEPDPS